MNDLKNFCKYFDRDPSCIQRKAALLKAIKENKIIISGRSIKEYIDWMVRRGASYYKEDHGYEISKSDIEICIQNLSKFLNIK